MWYITVLYGVLCITLQVYEVAHMLGLDVQAAVQLFAIKRGSSGASNQGETH